MSFFDYIQTFYITPEAINGALEVTLTSAEVFFKAKPSRKTNISGLDSPGISAWICEVENNEPNPQKILINSIVHVDYDFINTTGNATSGTIITFKDGVVLKAGRYYGLVIKYDDPGFDIWVNKQGDRLVNQAGPTNTPSTGSQGRYDGILYKSTNSNNFIPLSDRDLKFKINIAKYISTTGSFLVVNKAYEFFTVGSTTGAFLGGEIVYQDVANTTGTITVSANSVNVTGVGTTFTAYIPGQSIVVSQGGVNDIIKIKNITNNTVMQLESFPIFSASGIGYKVPPVGTVYYTDYTQNKLFLVDSNAANSTFKFNTGTRLIGERSKASANLVSIDRYKIDSFTPKFNITNPSSSDFSVKYALANSTNAVSSYTNLELFKENRTSKTSYILSRSREVVESNLIGPSKRSAVINVSFNVVVSNTNLFSSPRINANELDFYVYQNDINKVSDTLETRNGILNFDTEVEKNGLARSKAIFKKVVFAEGRSAEDLRVFLTAYRPAGTQINVYAKLHNSADKESFDDKQWTPLELKDNVDKFSNENPNDFIEYTYGLPQTPEIYENLTGQFTVESGNNIILASDDPSANVTAGDLIKVYDPLITENHEVFVVTSSNSTTIVVNKEIDNANIVGNMYVDKLKYKNVAWNNIANDNVARYVNSSSVEFDTFNTMQIKIVYYSNDSYIVPRAEQIQAIGVSA